MIDYRKVKGEFSLAGKIAVVTGGAGGIGEATAQMYARRGAKVALFDMKDNVEEIAAAMAKEFNTDVIGLHCDITDFDSIDKAVTAVLDRFGEINVLANCAGVVDLDNAEDIDFKLVEKTDEH